MLGGEVVSDELGIPVQVQKVTDDPNVYVKRLVPGTAADQCGLIAIGDQVCNPSCTLPNPPFTLPTPYLHPAYTLPTPYLHPAYTLPTSYLHPSYTPHRNPAHTLPKPSASTPNPES